MKVFDWVLKTTVKAYHNLGAGLDGNPIEHLGYLLLVNGAEKKSKRNRTSFWSEYIKLKQGSVDQEVSQPDHIVEVTGDILDSHDRDRKPPKSIDKDHMNAVLFNIKIY